MAINPSTLFPGKIDTTDPTNYPYGKARNVTVPGDATGTPWRAAHVNDLYGFFHKLLTDAAIVPSGSPETIQVSQYHDALVDLIQNTAGGSAGHEVFTANGTFNTPAGVSRIKVTLVGGGGGGGGAEDWVSSPIPGGGGGGAGGITVAYIDSPLSSYAVTIGTGGSAGVGGGSPTIGGAGVASSFGGALTANGGAGGFAGEFAAGFGAGGAGGTPGAGDQFGQDGMRGGSGSIITTISVPITGRAGNPGKGGAGHGAGGDGGLPNSSGGTNGGVGNSGICIVEYF